MGFDDCEGDTATQEFNLKDTDFDKQIKMKFVKF
jgi:hypothetical protein